MYLRKDSETEYVKVAFSLENPRPGVTILSILPDSIEVSLTSASSNGEL